MSRAEKLDRIAGLCGLALFIFWGLHAQGIL